MKRSYSITAALGLIVVILVLVNLVSAMVFRHSRIDLTSEKLYTLSEGTENILKKVDDELKFKLYISQDVVASLPGMKLYVTRVKELIEEFEKVSRGKVILSTLDPKPDTEEEELAQKYGLQNIPIQNGRSLYFGLVISDESGNDEVIPFFSPEREKFLEYDVAKAVVNISTPKKKVVGIISSLPVMGDKMPQQMKSMYGSPPGGGSEPWALVAQLEQLYTVRDLPPDMEKIDDDIDVLLIIHPKDMTPKSRLAIDQFLLKGGRILAFVDPQCEIDSPPPNPQNPYESAFYDRSSKIEELLASWGLSMSREEVAADINVAANVRNSAMQVVPYPIYLDLAGENVNKDEVLSAGVDDFIFASAGVLKKEGDNSDLTYVSLIETTEEANALKKEPFMTPDSVLKSFVRGKSKLSVGYRVSGRFKTAFPDGLKDENETFNPELMESKEPSSVIVFADVDFITDRFSAQVSNFFGRKVISLINDNLNLAVNSIEALAGSPDLISIRSRGKFERPFTRVTDMQREAQEKWRAKEAELQTKLGELETKLNNLQNRRDDKFKGQVLTAEQVTEINKFKEEKLSYQKQLREVRKNLREDVEALHRNLKVLNIWFMPVLISVVAVALHFAGARRRKAS